MIRPEDISDLINFSSVRTDPDWKYDPTKDNSRMQQVLGSARCYNILEEHKLALLADEVGMGKTIQALSICAALWKEKPKARILVIAPREEIARNWEREYLNFIQEHYRHNDNRVKSITGTEPVKPLNFCHNLYDLTRQVSGGAGQFYLAKITSFSGLTGRQDVEDSLHQIGITSTATLRNASHQDNSYNNAVARLLKKKLDGTVSKGSCFDLIIIDEAQYLRRARSGSLRSETAHILFGDPDTELPLASKILLLTATPNHSSAEDIGNIVSYFTSKFKKKEGEDQHLKILQTICVRRLRRLSSHNYNKYQYRDETLMPCTFQEDPMSELFFGLYQHQLVQHLVAKQEGTSTGGGGSRMMKYLEGVEFIPDGKTDSTEDDSSDDFPEENDDNEDTKAEQKSDRSSDFEKGPDSSILAELSILYQNYFKVPPAHPKYKRITNEINKEDIEKKVIFVRRIPSVFEISKRVLEDFDQKNWEPFFLQLAPSLPYSSFSRKEFIAAFQGLEDKEKPGELIYIDDKPKEKGNKKERIKRLPKSKLLDLFRIVPKTGSSQTVAANFRLRFMKSKPGAFSMFFSPGSDGFSEPYQHLSVRKFGNKDSKEESHYYSAAYARLYDQERLLFGQIVPYTHHDIVRSEDHSLETLLTIFWRVLEQDQTLSKNRKKEIENAYSSLKLHEREALSIFLEKGILLASKGLIDLLYIFLTIRKNNRSVIGVELYQLFTLEVEARLTSLKIYTQIADSILHFRNIYTKVFGITDPEKLVKENWNNFYNAQPVYPYNADNSSPSVLKSFNTPFFPDVLVATSVLQEGVNLQYFCDTIYHYGMAWTPGDNEQRIGRVDRMFGKIERRLEVEKEEAKLNIFYPYLKDTIDEEQLARFVKRKYREEKLIDEGKSMQELKEIDLQSSAMEDWQKFLAKRDPNLADPYPVKQESFRGIKYYRSKPENINLEEYMIPVANAIREQGLLSPEIYTFQHEGNLKLLVDPEMLIANRRQPAIIEFKIDALASALKGEGVYCITMKTPLHGIKNLGQFRNRFHQHADIAQKYSPGVKLCIDPDENKASHWAIYMKVELPLLIKKLEVNPLSEFEVGDAWLRLVLAADETERALFGGRDITRTELNLSEEEYRNRQKNSFRKKNFRVKMTNWRSHDDYFLFEKTITMPSDPERTAWVMNHEYQYVRVIPGNKPGTWKAQVSILKKDASREEMEILEKHLEMFVGRFRER